MLRPIAATLLTLCAVALADSTPAPPMIGTSAGQVRADNALTMELVWCPPGKFTMGSPKSDKDRYVDEDQVPVTLTKGFWLGKYEVTESQWYRVMANTPWTEFGQITPGRDTRQLPASNVSWNDAVQFCRKVTEQERRAGRLRVGWNYSLPTEAEWEYACRAATNTRFCFGDDDARLSLYAWFWPTKVFSNPPLLPIAEDRRKVVGLKKPNPWGLYDMHGNVDEWCRDVYARKLPGGCDPEVTTGVLPIRYVRRGGTCMSPAAACRCANRAKDEPDRKRPFLGFRAALRPLSN